ncbi:SRPBCC family protein [Sphaerisporangium sp. NPDC088356]|uniref:SRPBCC family protein n=1 Tax=Sphaerisporangium sp. NPDC088356 TaxID=3154871 RepID=UPI003444C2E0
MADKDKGGAAGGLLSPVKHQLRGIAGIAGKLALAAVKRKVEQTTKQLTGIAEGGGLQTLGQLAGSEGKMGRVKGLAKMAWGGLKQKLGFGGAAGKKKLKLTNIVESLDFGAPRRLVYDVWTQFEDWPTFTKKIEKVVQESDEKLTWQVKIFIPRRQWESTIMEQVPDEEIIWRSKAAKGYVDGSVTFHAVTDDMTRVLMVLEYHPKGLVEHIGNLWRAQGRRARLEFKHIRRHIMTQVLPHPEEIQGWRGVIHDGEVVKDHETAMREEEEEREREERGEAEPEEGEYEEGEYEEGEAPEEGEEEPEEGEEAEEAEEAETEEGEAPEGEEAAAEPGEEGGEEARERRRRLWSRRGERPDRPRGAVPAAEEEPRARRRGPEPSEAPARRRGPESGEPGEPPVRRRRPESGEPGEPPARRRRPESDEPGEPPARRRRPESGEPGEPPARRRRPETAEGEEPARRRPRPEPGPQGR